MSSTRAWQECPFQAVCKAWLSVCISTRALMECPGQAASKAWLLVVTSTRALNTWYCHLVYITWLSVLGSTRVLNEWLCQAACNAWTFGWMFDQSLENMILPSNLQCLTLDHRFNQSQTNTWPVVKTVWKTWLLAMPLIRALTQWPSQASCNVLTLVGGSIIVSTTWRCRAIWKI